MRPLHDTDPRFHFGHTNVSQTFLAPPRKEAQRNTMETLAAVRHSIRGLGWAVNDPDQKMHTYEVRPREDHWGVDLISDVLPFGRLLYLDVREAVGYAKFHSCSHDAMIRVYDAAGNVIEMHEHSGDFKE
jgi:hypothetical protein